VSKDAGFALDTGPELPVRHIGVLGCGRIGRMHAGLLAREVPGYAVAAVADAVPEAALGVSSTIGAPVRSIEELLVGIWMEVLERDVWERSGTSSSSPCTTSCPTPGRWASWSRT